MNWIYYVFDLPLSNISGDALDMISKQIIIQFSNWSLN